MPLFLAALPFLFACAPTDEASDQDSALQDTNADADADADADSDTDADADADSDTDTDADTDIEPMGCLETHGLNGVGSSWSFEDANSGDETDYYMTQRVSAQNDAAQTASIERTLEIATTTFMGRYVVTRQVYCDDTGLYVTEEYLESEVDNQGSRANAEVSTYYDNPALWAPNTMAIGDTWEDDRSGESIDGNGNSNTVSNVYTWTVVAETTLLDGAAGYTFTSQNGAPAYWAPGLGFAGDGAVTLTSYTPGN